MQRSLLILLTLSSISQAKNLCVMGETFPIGEKNLLERITEKLQNWQSSGDLQKHQDILKDKMEQRLINSFQAGEAPKAQQYRSWIHDPSITVGSDLKDHKGRVFAKKGTKFNPLDEMDFGEPMLFIDGQDPDQVQWAIKQEGQIILVRGKPIQLEESQNRPMYFDQQGLLRKKFSLSAYPARVSQKDKVLIVEELGGLS